MNSNKLSKKLQGSAAVAMIESCLYSLKKGRLNSRHVRDLVQCESCPEMDVFTDYLESPDPLIRGNISKVVAIRHPDKVVETIMKETNTSALRGMLQAIEDVEYKNVDNLTPLLKRDDKALVEKAFSMFVNVGRADLLFSLVLSGDDKTVERVRRYLDEQGWLE
jgi:hypothetical protein